MQAIAPTFSDAFKANPFFFLVSTALAAAAGVLALIAIVLVFKKPKLAIVVGALGVLGSLGAFGFGALGWALAAQRVDNAASYPGLTDSDRARLTTYGYAEARICLLHGALVSALPILAAAVGLAGGVLRRKRQAP
jgi:hypothetical protein